MKKIFTLFTMLLLFVASVAAESVTLQYSGTETGNMTGENDAATVGLDATKWSVVGAKGANSNFPGLNKAGDIRLYWSANGGNTITVTSLENATINSITITFTGATYSNVSVTAGGSAISGTDGVYNINASSFVLGNANTTNVQVRIKSIVINYSASTDTRTATNIDFSGDYLTKFTAGKDGDGATMPTATVKTDAGAAVSGASVTWTVEKVSGNDKLTPTISGNKILIANHAWGKVKVTASYAGNTTYRPSTKSYTLDVFKGRMNIAEILDDFKSQVISGGEDWSAGISTSYWQVNESGGNITSMDATVTYANGSYTYIQDTNGDNMLLFKSGLGFAQGDVISGDLGGGEIGAIYGSVKTYNGLLEIAVDECEFVKKSSGATVTPKTIFPDVLGEVEHMNAYLKIENAIYMADLGSKNYTFKVGGTEFTVRQQWNSVSVEDLEIGAVYTLEGMGAMFNTTPQLYLTDWVKTGEATGITTIDNDNTEMNGAVYNLAGQRVNNDYKGVIIKNGKKHMNK